MTNFIITADSSPVYDTWGFADYWNCPEWMKWYPTLLTKYTEEQADYIWSKAWLDGVSVIAGGNGTAPGSNYLVDSVPLDCRSFNSDFRTFLDQHPNLKGAVYSGIGGLIAKPIGFGTDVVDGVITVGKNLLDTVSNTTKVLKYAIPIGIALTILLLLLVGVHYAKSSTKEIAET